MSTQCTDHVLEGLISRAHDIDRFLALYRLELARIPAEEQETGDPVQLELEELDDLLRVVEELWGSVAGRTARLYEELQERAFAVGGEAIALHDAKWNRYLAFAAAAGIRVPAPVN